LIVRSTGRTPILAKAAAKPSQRLAPAEREAKILEGAVAFFAEVGFEGGTRELAARLGITQPLLYRYFPSKEVLLDRVYQEVYLSRWNPQWEGWLVDRSRPLEERLTAFYQDYARVIMTYEWVRLFMFAGLKGLDFNSRYIDFLRSAVFDRVVTELRSFCGRDDPSPARPEEVELVWGLHAAIYYLGVRRWIYEMPMPPDLDRDIALRVATFLGGFPRLYAGSPQ
jgi:AcrR family transcriptional regulator